MTTQNDFVLEVQGISKSYTTFQQDPSFLGSLKNFFYRKHLTIEALKPISFSVREGEFLGVLGPNGAGKTTTLKILSGLVPPSEGKALAFGSYDTKLRIPDYLKQIGMVMGQRQQLLPDLSALDSFHLSKALYGIEEEVFKSRLKNFLKLLQIEEKIYIPVRKLSLGERMKMELILSMLHHPKLLFLDEPTIGLDFHAAKVIRDFLLSMNQEFKMTILLTSHYTKDIEELCERVILINHGRRVYDGQLAKMDERIYGQRVVDIKFKSPEDRMEFVEYLPNLLEKVQNLAVGESDEIDSLRLHVPTRELQDFLSLLIGNLKKQSLVDLLVSEQALDDVFSQIYQNSNRVNL